MGVEAGGRVRSQFQGSGCGWRRPQCRAVGVVRGIRPRVWRASRVHMGCGNMDWCGCTRVWQGDLNEGLRCSEGHVLQWRVTAPRTWSHLPACLFQLVVL